MATIQIEAGEKTEDVLSFVLNALDDQTLDDIDVDRKMAATEGLVSEPITIVAVITATTTGVLAITRLVEKYMEHRQQLKVLSIVADGFERSSEAGKNLEKLAEKYAQVSISFGVTHADTALHKSAAAASHHHPTEEA
jgi:hypothetical protein